MTLQSPWRWLWGAVGLTFAIVGAAVLSDGGIFAAILGTVLIGAGVTYSIRSLMSRVRLGGDVLVIHEVFGSTKVTRVEIADVSSEVIDSKVFYEVVAPIVSKNSGDTIQIQILSGSSYAWGRRRVESQVDLIKEWHRNC